MYLFVGTKPESKDRNKHFKDMFERILGDKVPRFKDPESDEFLITNDPGLTLRHDVFDVDIAGHVDKISKSFPLASNRMKPLFAIVSGMGRGKTRTLIEIKKEINLRNTSLCLAITFNALWKKVIGKALGRLCWV